jgi:hypothetical protein
LFHKEPAEEFDESNSYSEIKETALNIPLKIPAKRISSFVISSGLTSVNVKPESTAARLV